MSEQLVPQKKVCKQIIVKKVVQEGNSIIETDAGVLCEVMVDGVQIVAYVKRAYLSSTGMQIPNNDSKGKENQVDKKADTSEESHNPVSAASMQGSSSSTVPASLTLLPMFKNSDSKGKWNDASTKKLLDMYAENLDQIGPFKKFKNKKCMWEHIAVSISTDHSMYVNGPQCESRFKTVRKRKSLAVNHNNQSGNDAIDVPYREEMDKIKSLDDSVQPEVLVAVGKNQVLKDSPRMHEANKKDRWVAPKKQRKEDPLLAMYRELQREKAANKERRHQEKMKALAGYCLKKND